MTQQDALSHLIKVKQAGQGWYAVDSPMEWTKHWQPLLNAGLINAHRTMPCVKLSEAGRAALRSAADQGKENDH